MGLRLKNFPSDDFFKGRDDPPMHYSFKITSFSSHSNAMIDVFQSEIFEAGDYKWKLIIYPDGRKDGRGKGHISIYLSLVDTDLVTAGWEVKAIFNLLVFDQTRCKYFSIPDGEVRKFHATKTESGVDKFIELDIFNDSSNGYLIDDTCVFGADVFVLKQTHQVESLSLTKQAVTETYSWKIKSFSALTLDLYKSDVFIIGDYKWRIWLYPHGLAEGKGNSMSVFIAIDESTLSPDTKVLVSYTIRLLCQFHSPPDHFASTAVTRFGKPSFEWGCRKFMSFVKLKDPKNGYLVDDSCIIEGQITLLGTVSRA